MLDKALQKVIEHLDTLLPPRGEEDFDDAKKMAAWNRPVQVCPRRTPPSLAGCPPPAPAPAPAMREQDT